AAGPPRARRSSRPTGSARSPSPSGRPERPAGPRRATRAGSRRYPPRPRDLVRSPDGGAPMDLRKLAAEALGTFWLVLGGCGAAVLAGDVIGEHGVALAFGLTVLTGAAALGHVSGGHFNPAVTAGLVAGRRFPAGDAVGYVVAQVLGAVVAAATIFVVADDRPGFVKGQFAANGFDEFSPGGY